MGGSPYANMVSLYGPDFGSGGRSTGTVRCVIGVTSYQFKYDNGVLVKRAGDVWRLQSSGQAKVSKQGANRKWVVVGTTTTVQFDVSFTGSSTVTS